MTRYFMTIPEAVQLIIRSGSLASTGAEAQADGGTPSPGGGVRHGAAVYVLDMGEPVRIVDLARAMIDLSGLDPDRDIDVEITGRRPGEKLEEELFNTYERASATGAEKIMLAEREPMVPDAVESMFAEIGLLVLEGDAAGLAARVSELSAESHEPPRQEGPEDASPASNGGRPGGDGADAPAPLVHSPNS